MITKVAALSNVEVEYIAIIEGDKEMSWLQRLLYELDRRQKDFVLYSDSKSAMHLAKNATFDSKTKHIEIQYHFIRSVLERGKIRLEKIHIDLNPADAFTKIVPK